MSDRTEPERTKCPECGSTNLCGMMASFWVPLTPEGEMQGDWIDYQSDSELTGELMCRDCDHEFELE